MTQTTHVIYSVCRRDATTKPWTVERISRQSFKQVGGVDLEIPPREPMREPPRFDE